MSEINNTKHNQQKEPLAMYFGYFNQLLDSKIGKALNLRKLSENIVYQGAKNGMKVAGSVTKVFKNSDVKGERLQAKVPTDLFDLSYNDEQQMIQETLLQFATQMRTVAQETDDAMTVLPDIWKAFDELQLAYMQVPESMGGMIKECSTVTQMMMAETLAYGDLGQALALFSRHSVLNAIMKWGTQDQQQELIPAFLTDTPEIATIAINEPTPLFSPFELATTAIRNGDQYTINGVKNGVPVANKSAFILVAAQTPDNGIQLFIIDKNTEGVTITEDRSMGLSCAELAEIQFKNVLVDASAQLGGNEGVKYAEFVSYCKLGWCALAVGCSQAVLDYVIPYCNERVAFGEPISHRQAVAFMIADMKIEIDSMRVLTQRAVARAEQGLSFEREAYLAHVFCGEKSMQIASNGVQLLGGHGFIRDYPVERWYRDLRAVSIELNGLHL